MLIGIAFNKINTYLEYIGKYGDLRPAIGKYCHTLELT